MQAAKDGARDSAVVLDRFVSSLGLIDSRAAALRRAVGDLGFVTLDDLRGFGREGLLQAARTYDESRGVPFGAWAEICMRRAMVDGIRAWGARRGERRCRRVELDEGSVEDERAIDPERLAAHAQLRARMHSAIAELPAAERDVVQRFDLEGQPLGQAAAAAGVSKSWASRLRARALGRLSEALRPKPASPRSVRPERFDGGSAAPRLEPPSDTPHPKPLHALAKCLGPRDLAGGEDARRPRREVAPAASTEAQSRRLADSVPGNAGAKARVRGRPAGMGGTQGAARAAAEARRTRGASLWPMSGESHSHEPGGKSIAAELEAEATVVVTRAAENSAAAAKGPGGDRADGAAVRETVAGKTGAEDREGQRPQNAVQPLQGRLWAAAKRAPGFRVIRRRGSAPCSLRSPPDAAPAASLARFRVARSVQRKTARFEMRTRWMRDRGAVGVDGPLIRVEAQGDERSRAELDRDLRAGPHWPRGVRRPRDGPILHHGAPGSRLRGRAILDRRTRRIDVHLRDPCAGDHFALGPGPRVKVALTTRNEALLVPGDRARRIDLSQAST